MRSDGPVSAFHRQNFISGDRSLASCLAGGDLDGYVICVFRTLVWFINFSRDTYDIYYANPALLPTIQADPAPMSESNVRRLEEGEPDATVDDICEFIVEYINSDVMVRSLLGDYALREAHTFVRTTGYASESAYYHCGSVQGVTLFRLRYYRPLISDRMAYSTTGA